MKKRLYVFLLFALLLLVGCQSKIDEGKNDKDIVSESESEDVEDTENGLSETETVTGDTESVEDETEIESESAAEAESEIQEPADSDLVLVKQYIPGIVVDLKYASTDNFTGQIIYEDDDAYLRYGTVKKLMEVQEELNDMGYALLIWDGYRPVEAQFKLWEICPDSTYVANPNNGYSSHSRGNTVDITVVTMDGMPVEMPTGFDDFTTEADRDYSDVSETAAQNSQMLEDIMEEAGFKGYSGEWWHYSDTTDYPVVE